MVFFNMQVGRIPNTIYTGYIGGELLNYEPDLASFRGHRILHGTSLLGGRTRVTALAVWVLRPVPVPWAGASAHCCSL